MSFLQLFSKAWYRTIKPENIINGFRATGVCPLNRMAIAAHVEVSSDLSSSGEDEALQDCDYFQLQEEALMLAKLQEDTPIPPKPFFSEEQIHLFQTRFENGYNLFIDKDYVAWVNIHILNFCLVLVVILLLVQLAMRLWLSKHVSVLLQYLKHWLKLEWFCLLLAHRIVRKMNLMLILVFQITHLLKQKQLQ